MVNCRVGSVHALVSAIGQPVCVIETLGIQIVQLSKVDADFAAVYRVE